MDNKRIVINTLSKADAVQGHGVLSAYNEQVALVRDGLSDEFSVAVNKPFVGDILHVHTVNFGFYLRCLFRLPRTKTVGYVHFIPETLEQSLRLPPVFKELFYSYVVNFYKRMDHLVTVNPYFIDKLEHLRIDRSKITYIPNFVSHDRFFAIDRDLRPQLRRSYGLDADRFTVLGVGQLQVRKGVLEFMELASRMPDVRFVWAGDFTFGKISDGYAQIKQIVANPPPNVTFLGLIDRERMNEVYNLADILFQPSYDELFPMTILEAMCVGLPLLLRDLVLYEGILSGYYLRGRNNDDFYEQITRLTEPAYYDDAAVLSRKGHQFYSKESVLEQWQSFYTLVAQTAPLTAAGRARLRAARRTV
ncbi:MAG: glycosyltransferase family 4 protein [Acetanaerobacterium sp.]